MKSHRSVGPVKSPPKVPVGALTKKHLSALEAFEKWQRESPHADAVSPAGERTTGSATRDQSLES